MKPVGGIDIGGTKIRWIILRDTTVIAAHEVPTPRTKKQFVTTMRTLSAWYRLRGIQNVGIGCAGIIRDSTVIHSANIPYLNHYDFRTAFDNHIRITVDNDARTFARAEAHYVDHGTTLCITIGTGIGRALIKNKTVIRIPALEQPGIWEPAYQRTHGEKRRTIIAEGIIALSRKLHPTTIIIGGGKIHGNDFVMLKRMLKRQLHCTIRRSHFRHNGGAIGAARLTRLQ